jgi:uncharacterized Zn-binding protein involved in type VI secretion
MIRKIKGIFSLILTVMVLFSGFSYIYAAEYSWEGSWDTTFGTMTLTQSGNRVTGTYTWDDGKITGTVDGNTLTGTWSDGKTGAAPNGSGDIVFTMAADGKSFTGIYKYGSTGSGYTWNGTRTAAASDVITNSQSSQTNSSGELTKIYGALLNDQLNFKLDGVAVVPVGDDGTPVLPVSYNGTTYLPVKAIGYLLGLGIDFESTTKTVLITSTTDMAAPTAIPITKSGQLIAISGALLNGQLKFKLDGNSVVPVGDDGTAVLPISYNGTAYLPARAIGYLLGLGIDYETTTKTVLITRKLTGM